MKIVFIQNYFCKKTGYSEYFLCKYLVKAGHEVHFIAGNLQLPYDNYDDVYKKYLGENRTQCGTEKFENFMLHIVPVKKIHRRFILSGISKKLSEIDPDIVMFNETVNPGIFKVIAHKIFHLKKYKIFTEDHVHMSVFPPARQKATLICRLKFWLFRQTVARILNLFVRKCYVIAPDTEEIMVKYFGISKSKISMVPLASDTDWFHPPETTEEQNARNIIRTNYGVAEDEIMCIYTGRFSVDKNPQCLADAVNILQQKGEPFKALFIGSGLDDNIAAIKKCKGCVIENFVLARDLPKFYRASDIGVWPKQESTSQLDAMATGLPLIVSNRVRTEERILGNAFQYEEGNPVSLADALLKFKDSNLRMKMGKAGQQKIIDFYNWSSIVDIRIKDFENAGASPVKK